MAHETILVVDDEPAIVQVIRDPLLREGFQVRAAGSAQAALEATHDPLDLIILDLDLPDMEGLASLARLDSWVGAGVPIVLLSAEPPSPAQKAHHMSLGYLQKPFSVPVLLQQVRSALSQAETGCCLTEGTM